jgi:hypothetical protein
MKHSVGSVERGQSHDALHATLRLPFSSLGSALVGCPVSNDTFHSNLLQLRRLADHVKPLPLWNCRKRLLPSPFLQSIFSLFIPSRSIIIDMPDAFKAIVWQGE